MPVSSGLCCCSRSAVNSPFLGGALMPILCTLAVLAGLLGLLMASQATMVTAIFGFGCLLAILARIAQAHEHARASKPLIDPALERERQERLAAGPKTGSP